MKKNVFLALGLLSMFSCSNHEDLFNSDYFQEQAKEAFPVENIDPTQTWETMVVRTMNVTVNETEGEQYTIKVYTENPFNTVNNATLLAKTTVLNGQKSILSLDAPTALQYVYVVLEDKDSNRSMKPVALSDVTTEVSFGLQGENRSIAARAGSSSTYDVPDVNDTDLFPQTVPDGISDFPPYGFSANTSYKVRQNITSINLGGTTGVKLYVVEDVTLSGLYLTSGSQLLVLPGVKVTMTGNPNLGQAGCYITVGKGASFLLGDNNLQIGSDYRFYNLGTVEAANIQCDNGAFLYNAAGATLTTRGKLSAENSTSLIANEGNLTANSLYVQGSGRFINDLGNAVVSVETIINSNSAGWENNGFYHTGRMEITATGNQTINKCQLIVDGQFNMHTSSAVFSMDGGSYTRCGSLYMDMSGINMGSGAFFDVVGEAKFKYNKDLGFKAIGSEWAVLRMGSAVMESANQGFTIAYSGNLLIDCKNHFAQGHSGDVNQPYIQMSGAASFDGKVSIEKSECNPGYTNIPAVTPEPATIFTYAFEDMTRQVGDYDFNDVVLKVSPVIDGKVTVQLVAAGAQKNLKVRYKLGSMGGDLFDGQEVHAALKATGLINTNKDPNQNTVAPVSDVITVGDGFSLAEDGDFYIVEMDNKGEVHIPRFTPGFKSGNAPYALRIASDWEWPYEQQSITDKYDGFVTWATNANADLDWYTK